RRGKNGAMGDLDAAASCEPRIGPAPGHGTEATVFEVQTQDKCMRLSVPAKRNGQAGATQSVPQGTASGPGVAQSANSDGHSECMAMWKPSNTGMPHDGWSKTGDRARLTPK